MNSSRDNHRIALELLRSPEPIEQSAAAAGISVESARRLIEALLKEQASLGPDEVKLPIAGNAEIVRDDRGVPHIKADDPADLFFALGYAQAQDRLWQLDFLRRQAHGRLSEIFGGESLAGDILSKTLDITGIVRAAYDRLGPDSRVATDAFAGGVNAWIAALPAGLPIEFELLGYEPEPWSPLDSLAIQRRWWWYLTGRLNVLTTPETVRAAVGDGDRYRAFFSPDAPVTYIVPSGNYDPSNPWPGRAADPASSGFGASSFPAGSNNWAAGPSVTEHGAALLASDPHVYFSVPADWYEVHLSGAGHDATGVCYPAMPGILIGRNRDVAWGLTNNICSLRDLYVESINPENRSEFLRDGVWTPLAERTDVIAIKGEAPYGHTTRIANGRPIVDHLVTEAALPARLWPDPAYANSALSLAWVGFEPSDETQCLLDVQRATTVAEAADAYRGWRCPTFNIVLADVHGDFGYRTIGALPLRGRERRGYRFANDPVDTWQGTIPFDELPKLRNPARGWVASANNPTAPPDFPYPLNGTWAPEDRAPRAEDLLRTRQPHSMSGFERMQTDIRSGRSERGTPGILSATAGTTGSLANSAQAILAAWDFEMRAGSPAPAIYYVFFWRWHRQVIVQRFTPELIPLVIDSGWGLSAELLHANLSEWFPSDNARIAAIRTAFTEALDWLSERFGPEIANWQWGKLHRLGAVHPAARTPLQHELLDIPPRAHNGGASTLAAAYHTPMGTFDTRLGANYRFITDLGASGAIRTICWPGQSGQPGSQHYADQVDRHLTGAYAGASMEWSEIESSATYRTRLIPSP